MGGITYGEVTGLTDLAGVGLAFGLLNETRFSQRAGQDPERLHLRMRRRSRAQRSPATYLKRTAGQLAVGLTVGLAYGLTYVVPSLSPFLSPNGLAYEQLASGNTAEFMYTLTLGLRSGLTVALTVGLTVGLGYGLVNVVVSALGDSHDPHTTNPWTLLTRDRTVTLIRTIATALVFGLAGRLAAEFAYAGPTKVLAYMLALVLENGLTNVLMSGLQDVLVFGVVGGMVRLVLSTWGNWLLFTRLWLPLTRRLPWRPKRFLEDAYQQGVLRRAGAVYQFRHARLRDHLNTHYQTKPHNRRS